MNHVQVKSSVIFIMQIQFSLSTLFKTLHTFTMTQTPLTSAKKFLYEYFVNSTIHGFSYLGNSFLHLIERLLWIAMICTALYFSVILSLESWDRYLHKSTVVSIERDHYYWNTSLPALTICPMKRLNESLYNAYAR